MGQLGKTTAALDILIGGTESKIQLDTTLAASYSAGQLSYDPISKTVVADTGIDGVRVNIGQELHVPVYNDTGSILYNGTPVAGEGNYVGGLPSAVVADADNVLHVIGYLGLVTADIAVGASGLATKIGALHDLDTSLLAVAPVFLASGGGLTNNLPLFPTVRLLIGGCTVSDASDGVIGTDPMQLHRNFITKSYSFTSQGVGAGTFYKAGFYEWDATDANLTQASLTVALGTANTSRSAHVGIVPSAAGVVDTGQVGLQVVGTQDAEGGVQVAAQTAIITDDITTLTTDTMIECIEKFSGIVSIELYVVSGTPTAYSLDFNYGYSKYEDFGNQNHTVVGLETLYLGGATDTGWDVILYHHTPTGWTYAATGFDPGGTVIGQKSVDQAIAGDITNGEEGSWKRTGLSTYVEGTGLEGVIYKIITTANNTMQSMDLHIGVVTEGIH